MPISIPERIYSMYNSIKDKASGEPFSRYKSWEYCYDAFNKKYNEAKNRRNHALSEEEIDYLALHLGFYLASWGMYRGSSFLLQRDYKTHAKAVKVIMNSGDDIWNYDPSQHNESEDKRVAHKIFELSKLIKQSYLPIDERNISEEKIKYSFKIVSSTKQHTLKNNNLVIWEENGEVTSSLKHYQVDENHHVLFDGQDLGFAYDDISFVERTDSLPSPIISVFCEESFSETLVTKILMGTIGSVPAYDRFLKTAIIESDQEGLSSLFNEKGLIALYSFTRGHYEELNITTNTFYPIMKKVDMYFWQYGYELGFLHGDMENPNPDGKKDSQFIKLLKKERNSLHQPMTKKDENSKNRIIGQLNFITGCNSLDAYYQELCRRNDI